MIYAVVDTNVIVAALRTRNNDSATARVMRAIFNGIVTPLVNDDILAEYCDVLYRPRLKLDRDSCDLFLSFMADASIRLEPIPSAENFPDPDDRIFYEIALAKESAYLVTGNIKHFPQTPIVVTPAEFCELLGDDL